MEPNNYSAIIEYLEQHRQLSLSIEADTASIASTISPSKLRIYEADIRKKTKEIQKVEKAIQSVSDPELRSLLVYRYMNGLTWELIAEKLNTTRQTISQSTRLKAYDAVSEFIKFEGEKS